MIVEDVERRVWAALRPIDAVTRLPLAAPMRVSGPGQTWIANRSGLMVLHRLTEPTAQIDALARYEASFTAPTAVAPPVAVSVRIDDPRGLHLSRRASITLPRAASATGDELPDLYRPVDVAMYPAPNAPLAATWAIVRVSVSRAGVPAAGCALTVHEAGDDTRLLGRGQSDARGEAVVAVVGIAAFIASGGATAFVREREAELTVVFEPAATTPPDTEVLAVRTDPAVARRTVPIVISSGRSISLAVALP